MRKVPVPGEDGLAVMQDQGDIPVLKWPEFQKQPVVLFESQLLPLVRVDPVQKRPTRVVRDLLQNREQGVGVRVEHCYTNE